MMTVDTLHVRATLTELWALPTTLP
jgi:hypothetical protein